MWVQRLIGKHIWITLITPILLVKYEAKKRESVGGLSRKRHKMVAWFIIISSAGCNQLSNPSIEFLISALEIPSHYVLIFFFIIL